MIFAFLASMTLILVITAYFIGQTRNEYYNLANEYAKLDKENKTLYNNFLLYLEENKKLYAQIIELDKKMTKIAQPPYLSKFISPKRSDIIRVQFLSTNRYIKYLIIIIWFFYFAVIVYILILAERRRRVLVFDYEYKIKIANERGHVQGIRAFIQGLIKDEDVLTEVLKWLYYHKINKTCENDAAYIYIKILEKLKKQARLSSIGEFGEVVNFDPSIHKTLDNLWPGEEVIIEEPGWCIASDIIKKPIVRKKL